MNYDKIILGAGLYGLYAAVRCGARGERVLVLEREAAPFQRATYINQARVHMGYHYPRSYSTAVKSARYFERFHEEFSFCERTDFEQIYATGAHFSWTNAVEFERFCTAAGILCEPVPPRRYFNPGMCDGAFRTREYTYDAQVLKEHFLQKLATQPSVTLQCGVRPTGIERVGDVWRVAVSDGAAHQTPYLLNATYAGVNNIHALLGLPPFSIKYELCEIILCTVNERLRNVGITVMDGPFFSLMPFGQTGLHSLTAVCFTPHRTSYEAQPTFPCQSRCDGCTPENLGNCNACTAKPRSAWPQMSQLARTYLREEYGFSYESSLFSMKPILKASEIDDSRPTVIRTLCETPRFVSVLSGKINTVYDLDEVL